MGPSLVFSDIQSGAGAPVRAVIKRENHMTERINTGTENEIYISEVRTILFSGKQNISWNDVERYLKRYIGNTYVVEEYGDNISIASDFPNEYAESKYTKSLRGAVAKAKAKANAVVGIDMIQDLLYR